MSSEVIFTPTYTLMFFFVFFTLIDMIVNFVILFFISENMNYE